MIKSTSPFLNKGVHSSIFHFVGQEPSSTQCFNVAPKDWAIAEADFLRRMGTIGESQPSDFLGIMFSRTSDTSFSGIAWEIEIQGYIIIFSSLKTWCLRDVGDPSHVNHVRVALRYVSKVICKKISNNDHIDHSPSHFHLYSDWWDYSQ